MSELWSTEPPTEPGWYWWRRGDFIGVLHVKYGEHGLEWACNFDGVTNRHYPVSQMVDGEWGPRIPIPTAPPVECWASISNVGYTPDFAALRDMLETVDVLPDLQTKVPRRVLRGLFIPTGGE